MINQTFTCLIVDDEPAAHYVLCNHIEKNNALLLVKQCYNALEAHNYLKENVVDLIFLDIDMPEISGLELLQLLKNPPKTILTTAHSEYALESYDYGVVDYLLKPVSTSRFLKAVDRALSYTKITKAEEEPEILTVKVDGRIYDILLKHICYIQSYGNYVKIFTPTRSYVVAITTQEIMHLLPGSQFVRIHKSFIVSLTRVQKISGNILVLKETQLPIGITYKRLLKDRLA